MLYTGKKTIFARKNKNTTTTRMHVHQTMLIHLLASQFATRSSICSGRDKQSVVPGCQYIVARSYNHRICVHDCRIRRINLTVSGARRFRWLHTCIARTYGYSTSLCPRQGQRARESSMHVEPTQTKHVHAAPRLLACVLMSNK
jgi:hypothetical protein